MLQAQNTVSGIVTDSKKQPIKGVSVYISELHKGTTTDEYGVYTFTNLPNGRIKLMFTYIGFETQNQSIDKLQKQNIACFLHLPSAFLLFLPINLL